MRWLWLAGIVGTAGCNLTDILAGNRVQGDAQSVRVKADSPTYAAPIALGHCSHYGLGTQFDHETAPGTYLYRCVETE
jgi:hypothetical protein